MENDPEEMNSLAEELKYKEKVKMLFDDLLEMQKELSDHLNLTETYSNRQSC